MSDPKTPAEKKPEPTPDSLVKINPDDGVVLTETDLESIVGGGGTFKKID
jgi:hypothetical protein